MPRRQASGRPRRNSRPPRRRSTPPVCRDRFDQATPTSARSLNPAFRRSSRVRPFVALVVGRSGNSRLHRPDREPVGLQRSAWRARLRADAGGREHRQPACAGDRRAAAGTTRRAARTQPRAGRAIVKQTLDAGRYFPKPPQASPHDQPAGHSGSFGAGKKFFVQRNEGNAAAQNDLTDRKDVPPSRRRGHGAPLPK